MKFLLNLLVTWLLLGSLSVSVAFAETSLSILSQNMKRLVDHVDDGNRGEIESRKRYQQRIRLAAKKFFTQLNAPQVIALQEVENINVLNNIRDVIVAWGGPKYQPVLLEGNDLSDIDVAYLVRPELQIRTKMQLFKNNHIGHYNNPLFSRPPLLIEVCQHKCVTLVNLHLRSMRGLRSKIKGNRVARKRHAQATQLAKWINRFQVQNPRKSIMVLGDFNALQPPDAYSDIIGTVMGNPDNTERNYPTKDWIKKDLLNLTQKIPKLARFSYVYRGKQQTLDYMLINQYFRPELKRIKYNPIDRKFSDHAGLFAEFIW